jgi:hypothetical protein
LPLDALLTARAALDVDPGEAEHERPRRFGRPSWRRQLRQQGSALRERRRPATIGEQAEVPDADEAVGEDVEQEAAEELVDVELDDLTRSPSA